MAVLFLKKLETAKPLIPEVLQAGTLYVRLTGKSFSQSVIDLALEQTVNRDAESPMRGIVGFHHLHNATRRWCITSAQHEM